MHDDVDAVYMEKNIIKKLSFMGVTKILWKGGFVKKFNNVAFSSLTDD